MLRCCVAFVVVLVSLVSCRVVCLGKGTGGCGGDMVLFSFLATRLMSVYPVPSLSRAVFHVRFVLCVVHLSVCSVFDQHVWSVCGDVSGEIGLYIY